MMSFDNVSKLTFFSVATPSNDFAISIAHGFTNSSAAVCDLFVLAHNKLKL